MARIQGKTTSEEFQYFAGLDVSKDHLDLRIEGAPRGQRFGNDEAGIAALVAALPAPHLVVFEPTGRYHIGLWRALAAAGHGTVPYNPWMVRQAATGLGVMAKSDGLDAMVLARIAALLSPRPKAPPGSEELEIKDLFAARRSLIRRRAMVRTQREACLDSFIATQLDREAEAQTAAIKALEARLRALIDASPHHARTREIIMSIKGLAEGAATLLLVRLPEIGTLTRGEIAALSATAPMTQESGTWTGRARTRGGRRDIRAGLHMCAVSAMTHNPDLKAFADGLRKRGKHGHAIITAVLRKLLVLANALVAQNRLWTPQRP